MVELKSLESLASLCNRCGFCQDVCPTYGVSHCELDVARGRIRTLRQVLDGRYDSVLGEGIPVQVDQCLLCGACSANCPSGVPTEQILQKVRSHLLKQKGFSLFHSLVYRGVLDRQDRLEKITGLVRVLDRTKVRNEVAKNAVLKALPLVTRAVTALPRTLGRPARQQLGKTVQSGENRGGVFYFMGCGTNVFTPDAAMAVVDCLSAMGLKVSVPRVPCCGGPHFSAGDMEKARRLARENIALMAKMDPEVIVTECATCAHTLHSYDTFFSAGDPIQETIRSLKEKIVDIHGFLTHLMEDRGLKKDARPGAKKIRVTYHDPCHGVRGMKVSKSPRDLISAIPGVDFREMDGADSCCGGAGSYAFRHPEVSAGILDRKIDAIEKTGADVVATSCPSCFLQISAGLWRRGLDIRVAHPVTLAAGLLTGQYNGKQK